MSIKSFLESQARTASDVQFDAEYVLEKIDGLQMKSDQPEKLTEDLTVTAVWKPMWKPLCRRIRCECQAPCFR